MTATRLRLTVAMAALLVGVAPALAQREQATPEQRIERLEKQLRQVQRQVFPKGQPADTAGYSDEPAATQSSFRTLDDRLNGLERQLADVLRQSEENGHRVTVMEAELARLRSDQEQRLGALERAAAAAAAQVPAHCPARPRPSQRQKPRTPVRRHAETGHDASCRGNSGRPRQRPRRNRL